ncbi:unnamed protein product [Allacma fusca]|uniref:Protein kinase domain-containing protein n=1 Tax=Allacma fusca TaxID=39272 RepID=A0A8J2JRC7_9HEXA|nr:unnamed protein product [Allacma fusca]
MSNTFKNFVLVLGLGLFEFVQGAQVPSDGENNGLSKTTTILISIGLALAGTLFVIICTWPWFQRQFRKLFPQKPPPDDPVFIWDNPRRASGTSFNSFMTLDTSNLQRDHPDFPPPNSTFELLTATEALGRRTVIKVEEDTGLSSHDWFAFQNLKVPRNNIHYIQEIGTGWFGMVIEAELKPVNTASSRTRVLVKYLREDATTREQMKFLDEAKLYRDSNHKNIMKLQGFCIETFPYLLALEHFPRGDLKSHLLKESQGVTLLDAKGANVRSRMVVDIAQGLHYMHTHGFTHTDLAARSCVVGGAGQILIGDYGLGPVSHKNEYYWSSNVPIPIRWSAPESLECTESSIKIFKATKAANVWSLGVVIWEICEMGKLPYSNLSDEEVLERVISDKNLGLPMPSITNLPYVELRNQMSNFITNCLHPLAQHRPTVDSLIELVSKSL